MILVKLFQKFSLSWRRCFFCNVAMAKEIFRVAIIAVGKLAETIDMGQVWRGWYEVLRTQQKP